MGAISKARQKLGAAFELPYDPCPECVLEMRVLPLKIFRGGVCRTHYRHLSTREKGAGWDGQPILDARKFHVWPLKYLEYPHQMEWLRMCQEHPWLALLAPCGHGKTQTISISYGATRIAEDPDIRVALIGATYEQAALRLRAIKSHLENNQDYRRYFETIHGFPPRADKPRNWRQDSFTVNRYSTDDAIKDPTVIAMGKGGELEDRRIDLIICDDMVTKKAANSDVQREADKEWFLDVVMTRGMEDCEVKVIGTPEHPDDLYEWILTGETETGEKVSDFFYGVRVRALAPVEEDHYYVDPDHMVVETEYPKEKLKPLCPDLMSLNGLLMRSRLSLGTFMRKYQCRHAAATERMFIPGMLMACKNPDLGLAASYDRYDRDYRMTMIGIDIATGQGLSFFAMTLLGIDMEYNHVVLNVLRKRIRFVEQMDWIMRWFRAYVPSYVFVESNGQQTAIIDAYKNVRKMDGVDLAGIERVAFEPVFTNKEMILSATTGLSVLVDGGRIEFPDADKQSREMVAPLLKEMKGWPSMSLKDCFMALLIAEAGYALKIGVDKPAGTISGALTIKGAYNRRVRGSRTTRFRPRRMVKQPVQVDGFGLPKAGGVAVSLVNEIRKRQF